MSQRIKGRRHAVGEWHSEEEALMSWDNSKTLSISTVVRLMSSAPRSPFGSRMM